MFFEPHYENSNQEPDECVDMYVNQKDKSDSNSLHLQIIVNRERERPLENAFEVLNQEAQQENFEEELEMPE
ncbi:hypothetical protein TNCV_1496851 [Trichonephila clavipes]|nr:hypothetical protein TNCV_1496851 [Trichonephila clavipes]